VPGAVPRLLFVVGALDAKFVAVGRRAARHGADLVEVADCGHAVHAERPEALLAVLLRYLAPGSGTDRPRS
jgi:pimeloyl-ACP methyl ester carboxylesterase